MTEFIFVRHGQSQANADGEIATFSTPLTQYGIEQARKTAQEVKNLGVTMIVCSPMLRAQQTAETIAVELGISGARIKIIDELRERGAGKLEGKPKNHETPWYYAANSPGLESGESLFKRMSLCLKKIKKTGKSEKLLVVGHSDSGFYLLQAAKGKTKVEDFDGPTQISNADFIKIKL